MNGAPEGGPGAAGPRPLPPRAPRAFVVHWLVDSAVVFLVVLLVALFLGISLVIVAIAALLVGLAVAPSTRRAEVRALAARAHDPEAPAA